MNDALADLHKYGALQVPPHLQDGHYAGAKKLGRAENYQYPHDFPDHWFDQQYLPEKLKHVQYFHSDGLGKYERALQMRLDEINKRKRSQHS
jgi:putative ATPase